MVNGTTTYNVTLFKAVDYNGFSQTLQATIAGLSNPTYTSPNFTVLPDALPASSRFLRIMVNGETADPGSTGLKTGTPSGPASDTHFVAGTTITFTVDGTDTWGNIISTNPAVTLITDDSNAKPSSCLIKTLTQGTTQFTWNWVTKHTSDLAGVTSDLAGTNPPFSAATATAAGFNPASEHLVIDPDRSKTNLQLLIQGETQTQGAGYWPSTTGGEIGNPQTFLAGQAIPITVRTVDDYWNLVEAPVVGQPNIYVQANDPHITNPLVSGAPTTNGVLATTIQLATKNLTPGWVVTSSGSASGTQFGVNSSTPVPIDASTLAKLQILVPGESAVSGDVPNRGKIRRANDTNSRRLIPDARRNTIRAVDAFYNSVSTNGTVTVSQSDIFGTLAPTSISLSGGASVSPFNVTLAVSTATFTPQVIYANGFNLPTSTSSAIPVNTGTPTHLQLVLPGETAVPGSPTGKIRQSVGRHGRSNLCGDSQYGRLAL